MRKLIIVAGPTASGKSDFAVDLALKINGEIISVDSRQIYRGLDIGTGKITKEEMKGVTHHMLDICDIGDEMSVSLFTDMALEKIEEIFTRGHTPILCGGTGQYIQSIINENVFAKVEPNQKLRDKLEKLTTKGLVTRLTAVDLNRAKNIDKDNRVRLIRAIEIAETIGAVPQLTKKPRFDAKIYLMNPTREKLRENINARLIKRLEIGMLDEGEKIFKKKLSESQTKKLGIEYFYMNEYLAGKISLPEMMEEIVNKSYQYAKRQMTWNKKYLVNAELIEIK